MTFSSFLLKQDVFGIDANMINLEGDTQVRSLPGAILSIITRVIGLIFAVQIAL